MVGDSFRTLPALLRLGRRAARACASGMPLAVLGCVLPMDALLREEPPVPPVVHAIVRHVPPPVSQLRSVGLQVQAAELPAPAALAVREVSLNLDTVLRLADQQNTQIAQARVKLDGALAAETVAENACLPDRLRQEPFRRTQAETGVWQRRAELSKVRNDVLQDAGYTYVDWLSARRGAAIAVELQASQQNLLTRARALAKDEKGAESLVEGLEAGVSGRQQAIVRLNQQAEAAASKLAYLLNVHDAVLVPADAAFTPTDLVDATQPADALVHQALDHGPGVSDLRGLQGAVENALYRARHLQTACNFTGCSALCGRYHYLEDKLEEVRLSRADLDGKLRLGVVEARSAILSGREEITLGSKQIQHAAEGYRLSSLRLEDRVTGLTVTEVQQGIRGLELAHLGFVQSVAAYNKAQVRLSLLLGLPVGPGAADSCPRGAP